MIMEQIILEKLHKEQIQILDVIVGICKKNNIQYFLVGGTLLGAVRHKGFIPWDDDLDIAMPREDYNKFIKITKKMNNEKYFLDYAGNNKKYWLPFIKIRNSKTIYQEAGQKNYKGELGIWVDIFPLDNGLEEEGILLQKQKMLKKLNSCLQVKNLRKIKRKDSLKKKIQICIIKRIPNGIIHFLINKTMTFNNKTSSKYFINFGSQYGIKKQNHLKDKYLPAIDIEFEGKMYKAPKDYNYVLTKIYGQNYMELPPKDKRITHNPIRIKFEGENEIVLKEELEVEKNI